MLDTSLSVDNIVRILQTGRAEEIIVTIPEGFTVLDIDNLLVEMELIEKGEAIDCANYCDFESYEFLPAEMGEMSERGGLLEGYLFPDTYYAPADDFVVKFFSPPKPHGGVDGFVTAYIKLTNKLVEKKPTQAK